MARTSLLGQTAIAALTVGVVTLGVAGCGNQNTGPGYAGSGSNSGGVAYADKALSKGEIMRVTAAASKKAGTMHMSMSMTGKAQMKATGDVAYDAGKTPLMAMKMSMPQLSKGSMEMRFVGGKLYMTIPGVTPAGKFLAIDPHDKTSPLAKSFAGATDDLDPMSNLEAVESSVKSAERVGKQTMDGVTVEHYKVDVGTAALVKKMGAQTAQLAKIPDTITYDLWLDQRHLPHRMTFDMSGVNFEATMSRWGRPVHVQAPPAAQLMAVPGA